MDAIAIAYDRTCLNTGNLNWAYMNRILTRWHEAGLTTVEQIQKNDKKPQVPKGASGQLGTAEMEAMQRVLQEG
jgi:DNA replication protein DnaD